MKKRDRIALICTGLLLMLNGNAVAADGTWTGSGANNLWTTSGNWDTVPGAGDNAIIDITLNNPLVDMSVADVYANVYVGRNNSSEVLLTVQSGGTLNAGTTAMWVAENSGSQARLELEGGTINSRDLVIGRRGSGIVNVTGGTMNMSRNIVMGDGDGHGVSEFNISAGIVNVAGWTGAGRQSGGMNTINVNGTGYLETGHLSVGLDDGDGTLNISDNGHVKLDAVNSRLRVGEIGNGSTGTINLDGGTLEVDSYIALGYSAGASGSMDMTDGDLSVNAFVVGLNGSGVFNMSGGLMSLRSHVRIGEGSGRGTWNMSGGLVEATNYVCVGWGSSAGVTDLINLSGGEIRTDELRIGRYGDGKIVLQGGTLNINYYGTTAENALLFDTDGGNGKLDVSGGTLNWMNGNYTNEVNAFILSGDIVAFNGTKPVSVVYDSVSDTTVITADSAAVANHTWTGGGADSLWTTAGNWDVPPAAGANVTINATGNDPLVNMDLADTYIDITLGTNSTALVGLALQSGGHLRSSSDVWIGQTAGSNARIDMGGGTLSGNDMRVGALGSGVFEMTGGTVEMGNNLIMGQTDGHGASEFNVSGGSVNFGLWMGVAYQSGGLNTLNLSGSGAIECTKLSLGLNDGDGVLNISDSGHLKLRPGDSRLRIAEGTAATGVLNMGGGLIETEDYISIGHTAGGTGTMNMTNGTVLTSAFVVGLNGDGVFNMTDGHIALNSHVRVGEGAGLGFWNMDGGLVEATNYICVGWGTSAGDTDLLDMTAGELQTGDLWIGRYGDGKVDLLGGTININYYDDGDGLLFDSDGGDGTLNVAGGTLNWMHGNHTTNIEALVLSGDIVAYDGAGSVSIVYNAGSDTTIVKANATPFELWMLGYGLSGDDAAATNDYDGDGLNNLYEYGLGGHPADPADTGISPVFGTLEEAGTTWFEYVYPKRSDANSGITYHIETRPDLIYGNWVNGGYTVSGTGVIDADFDAVTNRVSTELADEQFVRLVIEEL